jgi:GntR family transcriptional repressor for pyruvate dehydrogenase complex
MYREGLDSGDRIPSAQNLAENFGISINTVREALKFLESLGLLEISHGKGIFVRSGSSIVADLIAARRIAECFAASEAARRRTAVQAAELRVLIAEMDEVAAGGSFAGYTDLDLEFHHRIAEIAGNPIVSKLLENVRTVMQHQLAAINTTREILGTSMEIHRKICAAIERGESEAARSAMEEHIDIIEEKYRAYARGIPAAPAGSSGLKVKA